MRIPEGGKKESQEVYLKQYGWKLTEPGETAVQWDLWGQKDLK